MDEDVTGRVPGDAQGPEQSSLAERLIHDEFADAAPGHRAWFHRDAKPGGPDALAPDADPGRPSFGVEDTARIPVVATAEGAATIHEEFAAAPPRRPRARSHRTGMLAGLGVVGVLLAVLVLLAPGSGKPRLPVQSVHDVSPISASGPKTAAATAPTPTTAAASTTSSSPGPGPTTTQPRQGVTVPSTVTYVYLPGTTTPDETSTTTPPSTTPSTAPPPPTTTTTTSPPTTTTTTRQCFLGVVC